MREILLQVLPWEFTMPRSATAEPNSKLGQEITSSQSQFGQPQLPNKERRGFADNSENRRNQ
jgi:hypothetical protein